LPEHFTISDHDIRILTSTEIIQDIQQIKVLVPELMKIGSIDPQIIFDALTSKSLSELKTKVSTAMKKQKEENNALQKLQEQAEQLQNELKKTQQELQKAQQQVQSLNEAKLKLEQEKLKQEIEIDWFKAKTDRTFKNESIEVDKKKVEMELLQLRDGNPFNDQIRME
jgi:conjugal transfer/entry exclusion protein